MEQAKVLLVSNDAEFVNSIVQSWQRSSCTPQFTVSSLQGSAQLSGTPIVIMDGLEALSHWASEVLLAVVITADEPLPIVGGAARQPVQIRRTAGWADIVAALTHQAVLRVEAQQHVVEVEQRLRKSQRFAAMGHFIADARHGLGNALTSVLGNSELVLMETESGLRDEVRGQLVTIHVMSLKIHETLQRLSSLDREMQIAERQAEQEIPSKPAKAAGQE